MDKGTIKNYIKSVLENTPKDWLNLTTHRLDIYDESQAKTQFLHQFKRLIDSNRISKQTLAELPTAYDYIRLGHPLSSILEWTIAQMNDLNSEQVISFSSNITPILAILRKNLLVGKKTQICYSNNLPNSFNEELIKSVYGYNFEIHKVESQDNILAFEGSTIFVSQTHKLCDIDVHDGVDFYIHTSELGSVLLANGNEDYISEIQHVRRRETIAMTPINCLTVLQALSEDKAIYYDMGSKNIDKTSVVASIQSITQAPTHALVGSSGLSIQYAIMMGLVHDANKNHPTKDIKFIVPTNCYGGTNDQARRVADCLGNVEIIDLHVDGDSDMVQSIDVVLNELANSNTVPYIIAEIPTNPRVEVPNLDDLKDILAKVRKTAAGETAVDPVFVLDQTFCPNVHFLGEGEILSTVRAISYASGSKFPSGGKCTAGYCVGNQLADSLINKIGEHLVLCDNEATDQQYAFLAEQLPSMLQRIQGAYENTREIVNYIEEVLPTAKINFVSEELAAQGFTPSVFSLDLPTKGSTDAERETYKRELNHKLIHLMITKIPTESKYCVSYGQLKGCYWTIPATSTQGTTKEGDKDYIARVALSASMDLEKHMDVFKEFVEGM